MAADGTDPRPVVRAAGGVVLRRNGESIEVLVVHRPRYDDWSFPKGKRDPGETDEQAALREVHEETGYRCELGDELTQVEYVDGKGRDKLVRYWCMAVLGGEFVPNHEVDAASWVDPGTARDLLSYPHDRRVLDLATG